MIHKHKNKDTKKCCLVCDKDFVTSEALTDHIEKIHSASLRNTQPEGAQFACHKCGSKFKSELQDHMRRYHLKKHSMWKLLVL